MTKKISIAIDAMGGENSPDKVISGLSFFLKKRKSNNDFIVNLFGDELSIKNKKHIYFLDLHTLLGCS